MAYSPRPLLLFFQRKSEWVGLLENHPDLFELAKKYEKQDAEAGERYTWQQGETLDELSRPERIAEIKSNKRRSSGRPTTLARILASSETPDEDDDDGSCLICQL